MSTLALDPIRGLGPTNRERIYAEIRERMPVYWSPVHTAWILTRYADVSTILKHPDALALDAMPFLESLCKRGNLDLSSLLGFCSSLSLLTRPPRHEAVRRMLAQALGGIRRMSLPELLERRADRLLDCGERNGSIDLASGYGRALALFVIASFLGVPEDDVPELSGLSFDLMAVFEGTLMSVSTLTRLDQRAGALMRYFERLLDARRLTPADDGASLIVRLADEQLGCTMKELAGYCTFFFIAAAETTSEAIAGAALVLLEHSALRAQLRADTSRIPQAVRELLRLVSPVQYVARQLRFDGEVAGQPIRAGDRILLMLGAANRDPVAFPDPDEPLLNRTGPEPLAFAAGPYRCIGAQLATFEIEVAVRKLLERPGIRLSAQPPVWTDRMNIAPIKRLEACFT